MLACIADAPLLVQLPANVHGKAVEDGPSARAWITHVLADG